MTLDVQCEWILNMYIEHIFKLYMSSGASSGHVVYIFCKRTDKTNLYVWNQQLITGKNKNAFQKTLVKLSIKLC